MPAMSLDYNNNPDNSYETKHSNILYRLINEGLNSKSLLSHD